MSYTLCATIRYSAIFLSSNWPICNANGTGNSNAVTSLLPAATYRHGSHENINGRPLINDITPSSLIMTDVYKNRHRLLEVWGRARREAARCRKSEWKVNLCSRNFSRSNGSWQMTPKTVS